MKRAKNPAQLDPGIMMDNRMASAEKATISAKHHSEVATNTPVFVMDYGGKKPYYVTTAPDFRSRLSHVVSVWVNGKSARFEQITATPVKRRTNPAKKPAKPIGEPKKNETIFWAQTIGKPPFFMSPHFPDPKLAKPYVAVFGRGSGKAAALLSGTHDEYLYNLNAK